MKEKEKESEREYPLVVELLKSRVSTLEKQLAEKKHNLPISF